MCLFLWTDEDSDSDQDEQEQEEREETEKKKSVSSNSPVYMFPFKSFYSPGVRVYFWFEPQGDIMSYPGPLYVINP